MKHAMARLLALTLILGAMVTFVGCNTMEGAGEDIQEGGEAIEEAAE